MRELKIIFITCIIFMFGLLFMLCKMADEVSEYKKEVHMLRDTVQLYEIQLEDITNSYNDQLINAQKHMDNIVEAVINGKW